MAVMCCESSWKKHIAVTGQVHPERDGTCGVLQAAYPDWTWLEILSEMMVFTFWGLREYADIGHESRRLRQCLRGGGGSLNAGATWPTTYRACAHSVLEIRGAFANPISLWWLKRSLVRLLGERVFQTRLLIVSLLVISCPFWKWISWASVLSSTLSLVYEVARTSDCVTLWGRLPG